MITTDRSLVVKKRFFLKILDKGEQLPNVIKCAYNYKNQNKILKNSLNNYGQP